MMMVLSSSGLTGRSSNRRKMLVVRQGLLDSAGMTPARGLRQSSARNAEALDLPFKLDATRLLHPRAHRLAELFDVGAGGIALVDEEVAVHLRDLGIAHREPPAARRVDQQPGLFPRRVLEGRAAGAALDGLCLLAIGGDAVHLGEDLGGLPRLALEQRLGENQIVRHAAMAVFIMKLSHRKHMHLPLAIDGPSLDHDLACLAPMRPAVHAERAADAARDTAIEGEASDAGIRRRARHP